MNEGTGELKRRRRFLVFRLVSDMWFFTSEMEPFWLWPKPHHDMIKQISEAKAINMKARG